MTWATTPTGWVSVNSLIWYVDINASRFSMLKYLPSSSERKSLKKIWKFYYLYNILVLNKNIYIYICYSEGLL